MTDHTHDQIKHLADGVSMLTVVGTLTEMLPSISALLSIVWVSIRIWETDTVQGWFGRKKDSNASSE